jgi:hypothetical protein
MKCHAIDTPDPILHIPGKISRDRIWSDRIPCRSSDLLPRAVFLIGYFYRRVNIFGRISHFSLRVGMQEHFHFPAFEIFPAFCFGEIIDFRPVVELQLHLFKSDRPVCRRLNEFLCIQLHNKKQQKKGKKFFHFAVIFWGSIQI